MIDKIFYKNEEKQVGNYVDERREVRIRFREREFRNCMARIIYTFFNILFKAVWFYFPPFASFLLSYYIPFRRGGYAQA